jgi:hypothetical protein
MLDECVALGFGGGGDVLGATVVGASDGGPLGATADGTGAGIGAALDGGVGGVVVVTGIVGSTTPVSPNGSRDTTVIADTTIAIATTPNAATANVPIHLVPRQRSRGGTSADLSRVTGGRTSSEFFNFDGFVSPGGFDREDEPDPSRIVLVLWRCRGIETVGVLRDQ